MEKSEKTLFFGFDGVIADTLPAVAKIHNEILRQFGKDPVVTPELIRTHWNGWEHLYLATYGFSRQELSHALPLYQDFAIQELPAKIFTGMDEVIKKLAASHTLVITSSNFSPCIQAVLEETRLYGFFKSIFGHEELGGLGRSDPRFFHIPIDTLGLEKENIVVIGDTAEEVAGAKRAEIPVVACSWGWQDRDSLIEARPDYLADSPKELLTIMQKKC